MWLEMMTCLFPNDPVKWTPFWDSFQSAIHLNPDLSDVDKFSYLRSLLDSPILSLGSPSLHPTISKRSRSLVGFPLNRGRDILGSFTLAPRVVPEAAVSGGSMAGRSVADGSVAGGSVVGGVVWARPGGIVGLRQRSAAMAGSTCPKIRVVHALCPAWSLVFLASCSASVIF